VFLLTPTQVGYQDLAALLAQQPSVAARWREHLIASPFGTIHAATFSMPRPIGTGIPEAPLVRLASLNADDVTGSVGPNPYAMRRGLSVITSRTPPAWDDLLVKRAFGPLTLTWAVLLMYFTLPWLGLREHAYDWVSNVLRGVLLAAFFWMCARSVDVGAELLLSSPWGRSRRSAHSLVPLASRVTKLVVLALAVVALLSELGYPVASLLAGLGIGGVALALAAQKTVENLFGTFSIAADRPFSEGDTVKFDDVTGTVEDIGLRSTRIRTADRTLITVPNGRLADMRVESLSARDRMRFGCVLGLVYETTAQQLRGVLAGLEHVLRVHPKIWPEGLTVRFVALGASSLDIEINAWFKTTDADEFALCRQEILLRIMEVVEASSTRLAFPTRTVHVVNHDEPPPR
jgi:MscS family membrane protein